MKNQYEDIYGHIHTLKEQLGQAGGQGVVFRTMEPDFAVKLIHNSTKTDVSTDTSKNQRYTELRLLPIPARINLTLPCAELKDVAGYVMMLLDDMQEFSDAFTPDDSNDMTTPWIDEMRNINPEFADFISGYIATGGVRRRLSAYFGVARVLSELHTKGLVYCDFSGRNCFVSTAQGNDTVWLIDADNLNFAEAISKDSVFTPEYAAPEVFQKGLFSPWSDCYSFAISLFKDLIRNHPFMGALLEQQNFDEDDFADDTESRVFQGNFPWICDQDDDSNRGDSVLAEQHEMILTKHLFRLFDRTFSETGRRKRKTRPTMLEWYFALAEALDGSIRCQHCGMDFDVSLGNCPWCDTVPHIVSFESRKGNAYLWKLTKEAADGAELQLPARLIEGPRPSSCDKTVFAIRCERDSIRIFNMDPGYSWAVSHDGGESFRDIFGQADIPNRCLVSCTNNAKKDTVMIEVKIE
ncbi:protein kinase domain-containing protein [Succinimonas sp.]|uniref:protein kinase domain-containing protein n=1 Tax=Succinimonas sp. TaxID=1936151 RepID=UPI00386A57AD